jgi:hypothetical protein
VPVNTSRVSSSTSGGVTGGDECRVDLGNEVGVDAVELGLGGKTFVDEPLLVSRERGISSFGGELGVGVGHLVAEVMALQAVGDGFDE